MPTDYRDISENCECNSVLVGGDSSTPLEDITIALRGGGFSLPAPGATRRYQYAPVATSNWGVRFPMSDYRLTGAGATTPVAGLLVIDAARRLPPEANIIDLTLVSGELQAPVAMLPCFGPTGTNQAIYDILSGTLNVSDGSFELMSTGRVQNDLFPPGLELAFESIHMGAVNLTTGDTTVKSATQYTLPDHFDANGDNVPDTCTTPMRVYHVAADATGANDGSSWTDAFTNLQDAISAAANSGVAERIWVKAGTYRPTLRSAPADPRSARFLLKSGVAIYGGFNGTETSLEERDPATFVTTLSGDLAGNDLPGFVNRADNTYHVLAATDVADAIVDGFVIAGGHANGPAAEHMRGGGMLLQDAHPFIEGCVFRANFARFGGAVASDNRAHIVRCTFSRNRATQSGGALFLETQFAKPTVTNCRFFENRSDMAGGAISVVGASARIANSIFGGNIASTDGGAILTTGMSEPVISNCTLFANTATSRGGGIRMLQSEVHLMNSIVWGNSDAGGNDESGQIDRDPAATLDMRHCTVQGLTGGLGGTANSAADPLFVDANGADNVSGNADDNLALGGASPAINTGGNTLILRDRPDLDKDGELLEELPLDLAEQDRFVGTIDRGALERQPTFVIGDMNCDGFVTVGDISGFVLALTDPAQYATTYPDCDIQNADVNGDGFVSVGDIGAFVELLTGVSR
ncbi:MAG: hypothetical protein SF069_18790 [Phycisphaerae bacterium]|nr:hypothetical protein [Phycisphaerae bacterium]